MNLLLDARKKLLQSQAVQAPESGTQNLQQDGADQARNAGHNLFAAKSPLHHAGLVPLNRNLLYMLGGTLLLLAAGAAYLWWLGSMGSNTTPLHPGSAQPPVRTAPPAAAAMPAPQSALVPGIAPIDATSAPREIAQPAAQTPVNTPAVAPLPRKPAEPSRDSVTPPADSPIKIAPQKTEPVDPVLVASYEAYRAGRPDEARQGYLAILEKDARNTDALLGLAAIALQGGAPRTAAQYFGRVLTLDPRNATANAGMAALGTDEDFSESRLKLLLREQKDSGILHFALGNLYAGQSRWGEAQQAYFNAYALEPGNAEYAFNLAVSLDHLGQKKLAAQHYRRAMALDPSHSAGFDHAQISLRAEELAR